MSATKLSPSMELALDLLKEHGELLRWDGGRSWSARGVRPASRNFVDTSTIKALKARGLVGVDADGASWSDILESIDPADRRAYLTDEGEVSVGIEPDPAPWRRYERSPDGKDRTPAA